MKWIDEIVVAMEALGGAARYSDLYELVEMSTERVLTREWKATVRRTIEDHSSNSANFRGDDIFEHMSHGHWKLRGAEIDEGELEERERLTPSEVMARVFVREHWRRPPTEVAIPDAEIPISAWCDDSLLHVRLRDGREIATPLAWYPSLLGTTHAKRNNLELTGTGVHWPDLDEDLSVRGMLNGWKSSGSSATGKV